VNLTLAIVVIVASTASAVGIFLLIRRRAPAGGHFSDGDRAAGVFGVLATGFSVLLGFVVFLAFTSYSNASTGAQQEATDVIQMVETAQLLPPAVRPVLSGELVCYGRAVVAQEWPQLQAGQTPAFNPWGLPLFRTLSTIQPRSNAEQAAYSKWLDQTSDREQARSNRVQGSNGVIPGPLWFILVLSGGLVLLYVFFFADQSEGKIAQAMLVGSVTAMLVTSVLVIQFLANPYHPGYGSLKPTAMVRVLDQVQQASVALHLPMQIPCDSAGRARA
jgi:lipid-A-disaccharide synthase-like uncharacterized protein